MDLSKKTALLRLRPRNEPYWHRLGKGKWCGVRITKTGERRWIAKHAPPGDKRKTLALSGARDFEHAVSLATAWFGRGGRIALDATVRTAAENYLREQSIAKPPEDYRRIARSVDRLVLRQPIARVALAELCGADLEHWRAALVARGNKAATTNRDTGTLLAILNSAFRAGLVANDAAWRRFRKLPDDGQPRKRFLSAEECERLAAAAPPAMERLIRAAIATGARPSELCRATVADLDCAAGTLRLGSRKGSGARVRLREVPLSPDALSFFRGLARGRLPGAFLLPDDRGLEWRQRQRSKAFEQTRRAAGFGPDISMYSFRHMRAAALLRAGFDALVVARILGTSVLLLQRHYDNWIARDIGERLAAAGL